MPALSSLMLQKDQLLAHQQNALSALIANAIGAMIVASGGEFSSEYWQAAHSKIAFTKDKGQIGQSLAALGLDAYVLTASDPLLDSYIPATVYPVPTGTGKQVWAAIKESKSASLEFAKQQLDAIREQLAQ
jgi:hypothetical protein